MYRTQTARSGRNRALLFSTTSLAVFATITCNSAFAQQAGSAQQANSTQTDNSAIETVIVTSYRGSLEEATNAKRDSVNFTDSIFAQDIGKFPDTNIAESFNRIPGVTISRDIDGEGVNISIRGLGTDFTKVLLNGAQVAVASTGTTDSQNTNREVDLNMFPTELFTQLTVDKSSRADIEEGGAAGTVNMRSARPFDYNGPVLTISAQGVENTLAGTPGTHDSFIASDTWGPFGLLVGGVYVLDNVK